jgi:hypothetical protein
MLLSSSGVMLFLSLGGIYLDFSWAGPILKLSLLPRFRRVNTLYPLDPQNHTAKLLGLALTTPTPLLLLCAEESSAINHLSFSRLA